MQKHFLHVFLAAKFLSVCPCTEATIFPRYLPKHMADVSNIVIDCSELFSLSSARMPIQLDSNFHVEKNYWL